MRFIAAITLVLLAFLSSPSNASAPPSFSPPVWGMDLNGQIHRFESRHVAFVFLGTECPIARKSIAGEHGLNAVADKLKADNIQLFAVISDPTVTRALAASFAKEYDIRFPILFDASGELAALLAPTRVPEAFIVDEFGTLRYRGRINNAYVSLGQPRQVITEHNLLNAATAVAHDDKVAVPVTDPVGCTFERPPQPAPNTPDAPKVTWHRDISPLIAVHCAPCHSPGEVAPFSLLDYQDAAKRAKLLAEVTASGYMPPWHAAEQPLKFSGERRLSDRERALFAAWARAGAPEGSPDDAAPQPVHNAETWTLGPPDLILTMPEAFDIPASGRDIYRAFPIALNLPDDVFVTAVDFKPGAPSVVHHALLFLDASGAGMKRAAATTDGQPGYSSFGGPGFLPSGGLGGWAPGVRPAHLPDGIGRPLNKGSDLVVQIHYHPSGKPEQDRSRIGLYFAKKPVSRYALGIPLVNRKIDIPPGARDHKIEINMTLPRSVEVLGLMPHMHLLGKSWLVTATTPSGETLQLVNIPEWDFRWQDQYRFQTPQILPAGTKIHAVATYDNSSDNPNNPSDPPVRVRNGEQTTDEMCMVFFTIITDRPSLFPRRLQR